MAPLAPLATPMMAATMTTMRTAILVAKGKHKTSRFSQALLHEGFTSKWWRSFKIETWNVIKNNLLKFFSSTKMDNVFVGLNLNLLFKKKRQKKAPFIDDSSKTRGIK